MGQVGFYATHHAHHFCLIRTERPIGWARWYTPNPTWPKNDAHLGRKGMDRGK